MAKDVLKDLSPSEDKPFRPEAVAFMSSHFDIISKATKGKVITPMTSFKNSYKQSDGVIRAGKQQLYNIINSEILKGNFKDVEQVFRQIEFQIKAFMKALANKNTVKPNLQQTIDKDEPGFVGENILRENVPIGRVKDLNIKMQTVLAKYYVIRATASMIEEEKITELDIKAFEKQMSELVDVVQNTQIVSKNSYQRLESDQEKSTFFYRFLNHRHMSPTSAGGGEGGGDTPITPEQEEEIVDNLEQEEDQKTGGQGYAEVLDEEELDNIIDAEIIEVAPELGDNAEERKKLIQKIRPLLTDKKGGQNNQQKQIAQKEIENIKEQDPTTDPEETINQAAQKLLTDSGGKISDDEAQEIAQDAFISHTKEIKQIRDDVYKQAGFINDAYKIMELDEEYFPGFKALPEDEKRAISIFITYMSGNFDQAALQEQEESPIGGKDVFMAYLTKFMKEDVAKQMIKKMKDKGVLRSFLKVLGDSKNRERLMGYAKAFNPEIKDEPKLGSGDSGKKGSAEKVGLDALVSDDDKEEPEDDKSPQFRDQITSVVEYLKELGTGRKYIKLTDGKTIQADDALVLYSKINQDSGLPEIKQEPIDSEEWFDDIDFSDDEVPGFKTNLTQKLEEKAPFLYVVIEADNNLYVRGYGLQRKRSPLAYFKKEFKKAEPPEKNLGEGLNKKIARKLKPLIRKALNKGN